MYHLKEKIKAKRKDRTSPRTLRLQTAGSKHQRILLLSQFNSPSKEGFAQICSMKEGEKKVISVRVISFARGRKSTHTDLRKRIFWLNVS